MNLLKDDRFWNFIFSVAFISLSILAWKYILAYNIDLNEIKIYDLFIIGLATYRVTRLLIYDEVFYYIKDFAKKYKSEQGFIKSASILLTCPWCVGVWAAMITLVIYVLIPYGKFIILVLALSALAGFFHLLITWLGWVIDEKKQSFKNQKSKEF